MSHIGQNIWVSIWATICNLLIFLHCLLTIVSFSHTIVTLVATFPTIPPTSSAFLWEFITFSSTFLQITIGPVLLTCRYYTPADPVRLTSPQRRLPTFHNGTGVSFFSFPTFSHLFCCPFTDFSVVCFVLNVLVIVFQQSRDSFVIFVQMLFPIFPTLLFLYRNNLGRFRLRLTNKLYYYSSAGMMRWIFQCSWSFCCYNFSCITALSDKLFCRFKCLQTPSLFGLLPRHVVFWRYW